MLHHPLIKLCAVLFALNSATGFHSPSIGAIHRNDVSPSLHTLVPAGQSTTRLHLANELRLAQEGLCNYMSSIEVASTSILSTENIKVAFSVATFLPQIFWLFLILIVSCRC